MHKTLNPVVVLIGVLLAFNLFQFGCNRSVQRERDSDSFIILHPWDERVMGPYYDVSAKFLMFLSLFTFDADGHIQGKLAKSWEHSEDFKSWTFRLNDNVLWHDGVPVTAHDIKFTLNLVSHPDILFDDTWFGMETFTIHDDFSFTITFDRPKDFRDWWMVFWPKHILENLDIKNFWGWDFWTHPIGNGPYRYVRHIPNTLLELESNPVYYLGPPKIKKLILKFSDTPLLTELLSGNVDAIFFYDLDDIPKLKQNPEYAVYFARNPEELWLAAIHWKLDDPILGDRLVRSALTMAIDRLELRRLLNLPEGLPLFDVPFTGHQLRHNDIPPALPYDPEKALDLMREAGWQEINRDGILEKNGKTFGFELLLAANKEGSASYETAAVFIQSQLRRLGVKMDIQPLDSAVLEQKKKSGDFQAILTRYFQGPNLQLWWLGEQSSAGIGNPGISEIFRQLTLTANPEEVQILYTKMQPLFAEDMPLTFLFPEVNVFVVHERIKGLREPYRANPIQFLEKLWIEERE